MAWMGADTTTGKTGGSNLGGTSGNAGKTGAGGRPKVEEHDVPALAS